MFEQQKGEIEFFVNGRTHRVPADPSALLVDYLRSREVALTGTKDPCRQGGCGACTITLSWFDPSENKVMHKASNACLTPLCAVDGMHVRTVEGLGSVAETVSREQYEIGICNATQCGYCTPGFVMALHSHLMENPNASRKEIEQNFDGNICRCTGFRPILFAAKNLSVEGNAAEQANTPVCLVDPSARVKKSQMQAAEPQGLATLRSLDVSGSGGRWLRVRSLHELLRALDELKGGGVKLVAGNTSKGIPGLLEHPHLVQIDISMVPELHHLDVQDGYLHLGSGVTYHQLIKFLEGHAEAAGKAGDMLHYMARRTAGAIVRHRATVGGNSMLVLQNAIAGGTPFPSDLFTVLFALNAEFHFYKYYSASESSLSVRELVEQATSSPDFFRDFVLLGLHVPLGTPNDCMEVYKTAIREVNAHSIVNAAMQTNVVGQDNPLFQDVQLCFGAIAPTPYIAQSTAQFLEGKPLIAETIEQALGVLGSELEHVIGDLPSWVRELPEHGNTPAYVVSLAQGFLRKFLLTQIHHYHPDALPAGSKSATERKERPVSTGSQHFEQVPQDQHLGQPYVKESAFEQATGEIKYVQDLDMPPNGVQGAMVLSTCANASWRFVLQDDTGKQGVVTAQALSEHFREVFPDFVRLFTIDDIPGDKKLSDPWLAPSQVTYYGQPVAFVTAETKASAQTIASRIMSHHLEYYDKGEVLLTIAEARAAGSLFTQYTVQRDDNQTIETPDYQTHKDWVGKAGEQTIDNQPCLVVSGTQSTGSQKHFYMESQSVLVYPGEGRRLIVNASTQMPRGTQQHVAQALQLLENEVTLTVDRVGGAYGGKCARTSYMAVPAALAAMLLRRPVKVALARDIDSSTVGNRHPFTGEYNIAAVREGPEFGRIMGMSSTFYSNGGNTVDCSFDVMDCALLGSDGAYNIPYFHAEGHVCKTNIASSTSMRSYGSIQAQIIQEDAIEAMAVALKMDPADLREKNFYQPNDKTPYGQPLSYCLMTPVWNRLLKTSDYKCRKAEIEAFNAENRWVKRGINIMPMKYGLGYNLGWLMQGGALLNINALDGSVLVEHAGVEMGQGIRVKMAQLVADELNVPMELVVTTSQDTRQIPNPITTGATSSSDTAGWAVKEACRQQTERMHELGERLRKELGDDGCREQGFNFWDYDTGWNTKVTVRGKDTLIWQNLTNAALTHRVNLSSQSFVPSPGLVDGKDQQFYGFTYSAACVEVEIDVLTGETTVTRADVLYDVGKSLNPAIDVGQVEGAFVMGLGNILTEELVWQSSGDEKGRLNTLNTWSYKPPAYTTIPLVFNVDLFPRSDAPEIPINPNLLNSSKGIGEPPLVLASSAYFAIKQAVRSARKDAGLGDGWFYMSSPATTQVVALSCEGKTLPKPM